MVQPVVNEMFATVHRRFVSSRFIHFMYNLRFDKTQWKKWLPALCARLGLRLCCLLLVPGAKECPQAPQDDAGRETPERKGLRKSQVEGLCLKRVAQVQINFLREDIVENVGLGVHPLEVEEEIGDCGAHVRVADLAERGALLLDGTGQWFSGDLFRARKVERTESAYAPQLNLLPRNASLDFRRRRTAPEIHISRQIT
eukprot:scaffold1756_cov117-Isochrysis_galbana.AAC.9